MINTSERTKIEIGLYDGESFKFNEFETKDQSADILLIINQVLEKNNLTLKDLTAMAVNHGPGSFTGIRVGITVANTLAWSLDIPVESYADKEFETIVSKISKQKFSKIALPHYP